MVKKSIEVTAAADSNDDSFFFYTAAVPRLSIEHISTGSQYSSNT